ncbi:MULTISPECIES: phage tail length tape measure family protein [Pseudomonadota]|uniref:phage tail length tape measure family protein n=1 Tax=Pseudomonadota TaxID=1224 RepID=UPI0012FE59AB|nr:MULTISPECIES: phage tail length tape measure family protein [Pseudomonadota]
MQAQLDQHAVAINNSANVTRLHTDATGAQRAAMINASQQLQDVTVQLASGQRASVVFAQQLPQLGFALSGLEGSTNKTAARLGALGTFLAGPWGVAVFAGVTALGFLMESLSRTSDRLDETASAAEKSAGRIRSALENLQAYGQTASEMSKLFTDSSDVRINAAKKDAQAARLELDAQQAREEASRKGVGIDREYRQAAIRRAESAEARAKSLRNEANADRASAEATLKAAAQKERAQAVIDGMNATATGGARRGGGATVDREARAAAKEIDQLESKIQSLESRLDPAASAAREFADALEAINQAAGKGIISTGRAQELSTAAIFEDDRRRKAAEAADVARFLQVYKPVDLDGLVESSEAYSRRIDEKWKAAQEGAANAFAESLANVDILRGLFSGRGIKSMITSPDPQRMATGSDTFIGSLLYGRKTLADGQERMGLAQAYQQSLRVFERGLDDILKEVFGEDASKLGEVIGNAILGAQMGSFGAGITGGSRTAGALGGVLGSEVGKSLAKGPLGTALGKFSSALGPLGGIVGGIALGALGSALTPAKRGSATIGGTGATLAIASTRGNSRSRIAQSSDSAGEAITTLERIAEALGGTIDASRGAVSIGVRDKNFRVDTTGSGITKTKRGAIDFGTDSAAAIKFATMDLIRDGVIVGLRASTQRLLQNSKDLDDALRKATDFQGVFDRLQARIDPVAAAITGVDREFTRLRDIFGQAAASVEELADLEKLYAFERADAIREANERVLGSMQALLDDLRFGDNGRSLRDRLAAAQAKFDPLAARVEAGDKTAYDDFAEAARTILDIQRQFSGSQTAFFALQDRITTLTAKAVEGGNVTSILTGGSSIPSAQAQAQQAYDGSNVVNAIDRQTDELGRILLQAVGGQLAAIRENTAAGPVSGGRVDIPGFFVQNVRQI